MPKRASTSASSASARKRVRVLSEGDAETTEAVSAGKAGKILRIHLKNFMCHGNFSLDFNPRMNFILGHNGSGKSGILTAIIIGLGGTAKATNRSNSLGKLVKKGEASATIEIHIANGGREGYETDVFGDRIIIIRTIRERGGGAYKILDENRDLVSTSKNKMEAILRFFEITVNNPITILTQDCARTFLRDSDSKARFKLFKQGSGLEVIEEEIKNCAEIQRNIEVQLARRKQKAKYFRSEYKERMRIYEMLETAERAKERTQKLTRELKWVAVQEQETELERRDKELKKRAENLIKASSEVEGDTSKQAFLEDRIKLVNAEVSKVETARDSHSLLIASKKQAMQEQKNEFFSTRKKFVGIDGHVRQLKKDIQKIDENIAEIGDQEEREVFEREVADLKSEIQSADSEVLEKTGQLRGVQDKLLELERKKEGLQMNIRTLERSVASCREQFYAIRDVSDNLAVYGGHIPQFLNALQRNKHKFSQLPLGPMGRYVEVSDGRYKAVIEQLLSGQLSSFIVNTPKDTEEFQRLFAKECPNKMMPSVIQRTFRYEPYDTSRYGVVVPRGATSPLEQICCKNQVVMNTIIDMVGIEQILICANMEMGRKLTEHSENVPQNLRRVIVMNPLCEVYARPFRIYSWIPRKCHFIQVSAAERRGQLKEQLDEHTSKLEEAKGVSKYSEDMLLTLKQNRKKLQTELQNLERKKRECSSRIAEITDQYLGPRVEEDTLLEEKTSLVAQLEKMSAEHAPLKAKLDELTALMEEMRVDIGQTEQLAGEYETKLEEARAAVVEMQQKKQQLEFERADKRAMLEDLEIRVRNQKSTVEEQQAIVQQMISAAEEEGERIRTRKTREEIREQISVLNAQREVTTQIKETREEVMDECGLLETKVSELDAEVELGLQTLSVQREAVKKHTGEYEKRKAEVKTRMSTRFREILAQQSYHGDLTIDYEKSTLDLEINPRQSGTVRGTKSLSGGERSFSTVAFLLSMWSCIEHPFFLLDEYDVFTDGSNRELMTRMLMEEAMAKPKNQYMFLTPQDVSHLIKPSAELEVFKMPDKN